MQQPNENVQTMSIDFAANRIVVNGEDKHMVYVRLLKWLV
jgi:hypothetical protein